MLNRRESVDMPWESQGRNADLESTLLTVHKSTKVDIDSGSTGTTLVKHTSQETSPGIDRDTSPVTPVTNDYKLHTIIQIL